MPNIPFVFDSSNYQDENVRLGDRINYNCYPETTPGAVSKEIVRGVEGYVSRISDVGSNFNTAIVVDSVLYYIAGGDFYSAPLPSGPSTNEGSLSAIYNNSQAKLATNGQNIVILAPSGGTSDDYYFDISGGTLATIVSKDANWGGYGKALDVAFRDGYYAFVTASTIFHGSNSALTDGLVFNPLSFDFLPAASGTGVGIESTNSQLYVMTNRRVFIYQTASTTPFSFARSVGFDLDIGLASFSAKVSFEDQIFMVGNTVGGTLRAFMISGTSYQTVSNAYIEEKLKLYSDPKKLQISTFELRTHRFIHLTQNVEAQGAIPAIVFDLTETQLKGFPVWHERALTSSGTIISNFYPIQQYLDATDSTSGYTSIYAMGVRDASRAATLYEVDESQSFGNAAVFELDADQTFKQYTFRFLRNSGDPLLIKKLRARFTDNVTNVELFYSVNGTFVSLGQFDLTDIDSKTAEWRRLGRFNEDVTFRIRFEADYVLNEFNPQFGNLPVSMIEGYITL